jgi:hypothetical protein
MSTYRINSDVLLDRIIIWNGYLQRKVHLIACGGTAMTLLGVKDSTKDIDVMVPELKEYDYLIGKLRHSGYKYVTGHGWRFPRDPFIFDIFKGNCIHTTELLESPLNEGNHTLIRELSRIYLGVLNDYDLISSKLMRGTQMDIDDCLALVTYKRDEIDRVKLTERFRELASYQLRPDDMNRNFDLFLARIEGI